ncbi:MAG: PTS sugar transporter subunit IIA [Spirochaetales bacterium]|nr:PTS sugar transporter subunit IIA [Spirochaetales bacterium]
MNFFQLLNFNNIQIGTKAKDKEGILHEIASLARNNPLLNNFTEEEIFSALKDREKLGSTGFRNGIAIPHCSFDKLSDFTVGVLIAPDGVDFDSTDGNKTKIFFFIIGSRVKRNKHIKILSSISKLMKSDAVIDKLISIEEKADLIEYLYNIFEDSDLDEMSKEKCLLQLFIQNEDYFHDILQVLTSSVEGSISVIETNNAGYYLNSLPLFAGFWSDKQKTFMKIVYAVIDKSLSNDVIRRINMIGKAGELGPGVLITAQDLFYTAGSIDF